MKYGLDAIEAAAPEPGPTLIDRILERARAGKPLLASQVQTLAAEVDRLREIDLDNYVAKNRIPGMRVVDHFQDPDNGVYRIRIHCDMCGQEHVEDDLGAWAA